MAEKKNNIVDGFKNLNKGAKIGVIVGAVLILLLIVGLAGGGETQQTAQNQKPVDFSKEEEPEQTQAEKDLEDGTAVTEAMRKCTVMEAYDIYATGIGKKSKNIFNDGRETCTEFLRETYHNDEEKFIAAVNIDWENKKGELIDGKNLEYYLSILGW